MEQDDLRIKCFTHNLTTSDPEARIDLRPFNDRERVEAFIESGRDDRFEAEGEKILDLTEWEGFDLFGFSLYETFAPATAGVALTLGKLLKERTGARIVIGGSLHSEVARMMLRSRFIDYYIGDEGEEKLLALCRNLEAGVPAEETPGVAYIKENGFFTHVAIPKGFLSRRPPVRPCYDGLPLDLYRHDVTVQVGDRMESRSFLILPYIGIKGCRNRCAFCPDGLGPFRAKSPEAVAEDLAFLSERYGTKHFFFINTAVNPSYAYAAGLAASILERGLEIHWTDCANFLHMDGALLEKLKAAGAASLAFGTESLSPRILDYINKPFPTLDRVETILETAYDLGIGNELDIICGFPYESAEDMDLTIAFLTKMKRYIRHCHLNKFRPAGLMGKYPGKWGIRLLEMGPSTHRKGHAIPFEEIDGLGWHDKADQIDRFYDRVRETMAVNGYGVNPAMDRETFLFLHFLKAQYHQVERKSTVPSFSFD